MSIPFTPLEVFCSFADEDVSLLEQLEQHLSILWREGQITIWHRSKIVAGKDCQMELNQHLNTASLILLLISPNFFKSNHCYSVEMQRAMQRHEAGETRVIPLLLRPVANLHLALFKKLKALPSNDKSVTEWSNGDMAFADIAQGISAALDDIQHLPSPFPLSGVENLPYRCDEYFTGRDQELECLHMQLHQRTAADIGQIQAISGLGGIGKTALAVEYAYRYHDDYSWRLFARADSTEALTSSYIKIAALLDLPQKDTQEQGVIVQAVKIWLKTQQRYLLILDNADELKLLDQFVPSDARGHFLITTRAADPSTLKLGMVNSLPLKEFSEEQGIDFILRRADLSYMDHHEQTRQLVRELGGLPLALDCAGAYLRKTKCGLDNYLTEYQRYGSLLLDERSDNGSSGRIMTTWTISFKRATRNKPNTANLFYLCAFLAPDAIPEVILIKGAKALGPVFAPITDVQWFNRAISDLRAYSLIERHRGILTMHRVVQDVLRRSLSPEEQLQWKQHAVQIVNATLPGLEHTYWADCEKWLSHAFICAQWILDEKKSFLIAPPLLSWAGSYLRERARYNEAERFLQQSHALNEPTHKTASLAETTDLSNLAFLSWCKGAYQEAETWLLRALAIYKGRLSYESLSSDERLQHMTCLQNLACIYQTQGKYEEGEAWFLQAREQADGAIVQSNLAELYRRLGRYDEADLLLKQALCIHEQQREHEDLLHTAYIFHKQALLSFDQGKYSEAESLFARTRAVYEKCLGPEHPHTAQILHGLAEVYRIQSKYDEAEKFFQQVLDILEKKLGREHSTIASVLNGLALLYLEQGKEQGKYIYVKQERCMKLGKYGKAGELFQRALDIRVRKLGQEHPDTALILYNLALLSYDQGEYKEAEERFQQALMVWQKQLNSEHPYIVHILYHMGLLHYVQKKDKDAEARFLQVLEIWKCQFGQEHPDMILCLNNLASLYQMQRRYSEAEPLYRRALAASKQQLGSEHSITQAICENYISLLRRMGHEVEAEQLEAES